MITKEMFTSILGIKKISKGVSNSFRYWRDWLVYSRMPRSEHLSLRDAYPCLYDRAITTPLDAHYFYQDIWAFKLVRDSRVDHHVDVGSRVILVGMLTTVTDVTFIDIRPLKANLSGLESKHGSVLDLPFEDESVSSLSCLHVAEHIGLGRYGDPLDPKGTQKACRELERVLSPGGSLYFAVPVGVPRVCFNAHRIHSPQQILDYFPRLRLVDFSGVTDQGEFLEDIEPDEFVDSRYACGLFFFTKAL
jgi:SAM-dependent methyltransferase